MQNDIQLTPHFMLSEFIKSATASAKKIDNTPSKEVVENLKTLCEQVLEPLRAEINKTTDINSASLTKDSKSPFKGDLEGLPVVISSGYRCPALNKAVGGAAHSQHITGEAADIHIPDEETGKKWFTWMMYNLHFDQLIWEKSTPSSTHHWIHVSFRKNGKQRQQVIQEMVKNP